MRSTWKEHAMNLAAIAMRRSEDPFQQVGACVLGYHNEVLAVAYNGLAAGVNVTPEFWKDRDARRPYMIHAESNVLSRIKMGEGKLLACTLLPCSACATNIAAYGIKEVIFKDIYNRDTKSIDIFKFYGISCTQVDPTYPL